MIVSATTKMIVTNPGENCSVEMNVSYHLSTLTSSYVIYSTNEDFTDQSTAASECVALPFSSKENEYQCKAILRNLQPNTRYYYKIANDPNQKVMSFTTAKQNNFTFGFITDVHSYFFTSGSNTRVEKANKVLNTMNSRKPLDFIVASGDVVAYGTVYEQWEALYGMDLMKSTMFATTPGNHDYYNNKAETVGVQYFNAVTFNPQNGATGVENSSYYFRYGNTLFISLDSEAAANNATYRANQIKWLNEVTANNPADFIIAFTHRPFYTGDGKNAGQANDMKNYFQEIFDNTGVDLVLSGHNHVYARTKQVYKNQVITGQALGTYYITGIQIGDRYATDPGTKQPQVEVALLGANQDGGNLITVGKDKITVEFVKHDGTIYDQFEIFSKSNLINQSEIEKNINVSKDKENEAIVINYDIPSPGLIKKVEVINENEEVLETLLNPTIETITIENAPKVGKYKLKLKLSLRNGNTINKELLVYDDRYDYGTVKNVKVKEETYYSELHWDADFTEIVDHIDIFVNGLLLKQVNKSEKFTKLDKVNPYKENNISFRVISKENKELYRYDFVYGENADSVNIEFKEKEIKIKVGDIVDLDYTVTPAQEVIIEATTTDENVAYVDENGKIVAVGVGECEITINIAKRWDASTTIKVIVEPAPTKKGCFKSSYILSGVLAFALIIFLRKRRII